MDLFQFIQQVHNGTRINMTFRPQYGMTTLYVSGINAKSTGATLIGTTLPGMRFVPFKIGVEATVLTGASTGPTFTIGTNASSYNNILSSTTWSPVDEFQFNLYGFSSGTISVAPSTGIYIDITSASTSTSFTLRVTLRGVYV